MNSVCRLIIISVIVFSGCQVNNQSGAKHETEKDQSIRKAVTLSDNWRFQIDIRNIGEEEGWFRDGFDRNSWGEQTVPQAWDCYETALWGYEGIGWYSTTINPEDFDPGKRTVVEFGRVMFYSKLWINGEYIGENIGGYLPFSFDITKYLKPGQENSLVVRVDNKPRMEWLPGGKQIEWIQYGGILEPVKLTGTTLTYIDDFTVQTDLADGKARLNCIASVVNETGATTEMNLEIEIARGNNVVKKDVRLHYNANDSITARVEIEIDHPELWSPETPVLYTAKARLKNDGSVTDEVCDRIGLRTIRTEGTSILLNGKPIKIKGVNRYDEYGRMGPTVPEETLRAELELMKSVGINTIRVHYPQSPDLISLYDEYGFMMMEEVPLNWWGGDTWGEVQESPDILDFAKPALRKMIRRDKNHPSIVIWSMANESATSTEPGITVVRELIRLAKSLDTTRLVTFVSARDPRKHPAFDEADVVCFNKYNGISRGGRICEHIADIDSFAYKPTAEELTLYRQYYSKPIFMTEFGCQSIKNMHGDVYYTEEFQAAYIEKVWKAIQESEGISGGILWSWADYYHRKYFINYAVYGPYGVVTVDRQLKKGLEALARMYGGSLPQK